MRYRIAQALCGALWLLVSAERVRAQDSGAWQLTPQLMTAVSGSHPGFFFGGSATGVRQSAVAVRASTTLVRLGPIRLRYAAELLPFVTISGVERYTALSTDGGPLYVVAGTRTARGIGVTPLGLDVDVAVSRRVRIEGSVAGGILRFSQNVPTAAARQRNFSMEWDGALLIDAGRGRWIRTGIRWKHISNGFTAIENPGFDSRMLFAGMGFSIRAPR
jgi:hypothetical protein